MTSLAFRLVRFDEYPALVAGVGHVAGELYEVDPWLLSDLDRFEDCPELYQRQAITLDDGSQAFSYTMSSHAVAGCPEVEGGIWREDDEVSPGGR